MSTEGIRSGADRPITTKANVGNAQRLEDRCGHDRVAWLIDRETWHTTSEVWTLEPCDAPPARARGRRSR